MRFIIPYSRFNKDILETPRNILALKHLTDVDFPKYTTQSDCYSFWLRMIVKIVTNEIFDLSDLELISKLEELNETKRLVINFKGIENVIPKGTEQFYFSSLVVFIRDWCFGENRNINFFLFIPDDVLNNELNIVDRTKLNAHIYK